MKWKDFRELTPEQRRECRRSRSHAFKARARFAEAAVRRLPQFDSKKFPEVGRAFAILAVYRQLTSYRQFAEWLNWSVPVGDGWTRKAPTELLIIGQQYPDTIFGFYDDGKFVPGLLPLMMLYPTLYTDPLDDILSEDDIARMTVGEIVAISAKRGFRTSAEVVRQRVHSWDKGERENSQQKPHAK